jgi:hypothetical protein
MSRFLDAWGVALAIVVGGGFLLAVMVVAELRADRRAEAAAARACQVWFHASRTAADSGRVLERHTECSYHMGAE